MIVVGIVGGIGAGKTEVLRLLADLGAATVAADELNREVLAPGAETLGAVRAAFGDAYFEADGQLRRRALGDLIFRDEAARRRLEAIVHPAMLARLQARLAQWRTAQVPVAVVEAAVLAQMGALELVDRVLLVSAPESLRRQRLQARDGLDAGQVGQRLALQAQMGLDAPAADYEIVNDCDLASLREKVERFWRWLV